jgi:hypothetical protein
VAVVVDDKPQVLAELEEVAAEVLAVEEIVQDKLP